MPKRKRGITGMLPVDGRQLENVKGEWLKLKKKEAADCQLWHNVGRREEPRKQKNKEIDDWQSFYFKLIFGSYYFCFVQFSLFPMPKRKRGITEMLPVDGRQLENVKGEWLKLKKKEAAACQGRQLEDVRGERLKQKNKELADCQTWHNVGRREEPRKQKNKEMDDWQ
ncbi:hypothetical protein AVEN_58590-1 [Araneus ventricosus]|uniref:Uncharacterized protein n=1 Tax=Araneus ventricosus TaxID=182803 RepID=A0A4Y2GWH9_ARAVE|nr:hypothetical protein AVEN_58590-1 [Araneus ventricosus]